MRVEAAFTLATSKGTMKIIRASDFFKCIKLDLLKKHNSKDHSIFIIQLSLALVQLTEQCKSIGHHVQLACCEYPEVLSVALWLTVRAGVRGLDIRAAYYPHELKYLAILAGKAALTTAHVSWGCSQN